MALLLGKHKMAVLLATGTHQFSFKPQSICTLASQTLVYVTGVIKLINKAFNEHDGNPI